MIFKIDIGTLKYSKFKALKVLIFHILFKALECERKVKIIIIKFLAKNNLNFVRKIVNYYYLISI